MEDSTNNITVSGRKRVFDGFMKVDAWQYRLSGSAKLYERLVIERGDAVAALVHLTDTDELLFVRQFRAPTYDKAGGYIWEIAAGMIDANESPEAAIKRELAEETGFEVAAIAPINRVFVSPGYTTERVHVFYAQATHAHKTTDGGGLIAEGEQIETVFIPRQQAFAMLLNNEIEDAKTVLALWWLKAQQPQV